MENKDHDKQRNSWPWPWPCRMRALCRSMTFPTAAQQLSLPCRTGLLWNPRSISAAARQLNLPLQDGTSPYFGVLVGRCANRIEGANFALNGTVYRVPANDGRNSLHGGIKGFDKHIWDSKQIEHPDGEAVRLTRTSPDGEEGYPGTVQVAVT